MKERVDMKLAPTDYYDMNDSSQYWHKLIISFLSF